MFGRIIFSLLFVGLSTACSGPSGVDVQRAAYGEAWPFTIDGGTIQCEHESARSQRLLVTLENNGIAYGLNGSAIDFGFPHHKSILKPDKTGADVQRFIDIGLASCRS